MDKIVNTIKLFINKHNLNGEKIIVAFSGGFDSMCLLNACFSMGLKVTAAHLNHNWRGQESENEAKYCEEFCMTRGIEFYTEILPDNIKKTETAAREARYAFYERAAEKYHSKCVFTAHNADDNAETVLYRIIKGTGIYGLDGIREQRDIIYRPLLSVYRNEIEQYCIENNLHPCSDSSNSNTKYKRNLIRHEILPLIETINKDAKFAINSLSQIAAEENKIIDNYLPDFTLTGEFIALQEPLQKRIIHKILKSNNLEYSREKIENICSFIRENSSSKSGKIMSLTTGINIFVNTENIKIILSDIKTKFSLVVSQCGEYNLPDGKFLLEKCETSPKVYPHDSSCIAYADLSEVTFPFVLRSRNDGDIIRPLGIHGRKKLKKYLNDKKIPNHEKEKMLFLCKGNEVIWAPSIGISDRIKVKEHPTHILKILK